MQRVQIFQALPVLLLVLLTLASNFAAKDGKKCDFLGCSDRWDGLSENPIIFAGYRNWLVVSNIFCCPSYMGCHPSHFKMVKTTNQIMIQIDLLPASP